MFRPEPALLLIVMIAAAWRLALLSQVPVISRDGVTFCLDAQALGRHGCAFLRSPEAEQHPLYPALILAVQRGAVLAGAPATPLTWQRCGQAVALAGSLAVILLVAELTRQLVRRLALPVDAALAVVLAAALTALLETHVMLAVDVMSDEIHLAFYLASVLLLLLTQQRLAAAAACGLFAGLAFLTRQEGLVPAIAAVAVLVLGMRQLGARRTTLHALAVVVGFLVIAGPYWVIAGRFSTKKDLPDLLPAAHAAAPAERCAAPCYADATPPSWETLGSRGSETFSYARLQTHEVSWFGLLPYALVQIFRGGRVIIPLLALLPLWQLKERWRRSPLLGIALCMVGHLALLLLLLGRFGYLQPRHTLVIVALLTPLAALQLARFVALLWAPRRATAVTLLAICFLPLALYSLRVPNHGDRYLWDVVHWLAARDPQRASKPLYGEKTHKRVAFYADMQWVWWPSQPDDEAAMRAHLNIATPAYLLVEFAGTGDQFERQGNRELLARIQADPALAARLTPVYSAAGPQGSEVKLFTIEPATRRPE